MPGPSTAGSATHNELQAGLDGLIGLRPTSSSTGPHAAIPDVGLLQHQPADRNRCRLTALRLHLQAAFPNAGLHRQHLDSAAHKKALAKQERDREQADRVSRGRDAAENAVVRWGCLLRMLWLQWTAQQDSQCCSCSVPLRVLLVLSLLP